MIKHPLNSDSYVLLLLCSDLALFGRTEKPFTLKQWDVLSRKLLELKWRPRAFLELPTEQWSSQLALADVEVHRIEKLLSRSAQLGLEIERLGRSGIWITTRAESSYPHRYKKLLRTQAPVVLYGAGEISFLGDEAASAAVVGSRDVDEDGQIFAAQLGEKLANESLIVISGGSKGVDSIAEHAALRQGGKVISVLSDGMEATIRRKEIRDYILQKQLLVISAVRPDARFRGYTAMERNKYIYTLADYAFVVSSSAGKGGTWGGAKENLENAWIPLFVRDDATIPEGNKALIERGGIRISKQDLLENSLREWIPKQKQQMRQVVPTTVQQGATEQKDLFEIIWPHFENMLTVTRSVGELSRYFRLYPDQTRQWLDHAVKINKAVRTSKGYALPKSNTNAQPDVQQISLF